MRILLTYNPSAGDDGTDVDELVAELEGSGHAVEAQSTKEDHWEDSLDRPVDLVVIAGGDGTVAKVFKQLAGRGRPAAIVPSGSANNIARSLGYKDDAPEVAIGRRRMRFDIGLSAWKGRAERFVESAGGGVFAEMVARAAEAPADSAGDKVELGLRHLVDVAGDARAAAWQVEADGTDLSGGYIAVEVMNGKSLGPNVPLAPEADAGDGLLDLVLVRESERAALTAHALARLDGRPAPQLWFERRRAHEIVLDPPASSPFRYDSELVHEPPATLVATVETSVEVIVP